MIKNVKMDGEMLIISIKMSGYVTDNQVGTYIIHYFWMIGSVIK